ncbi:hypothetical protein D3C71_1218480 [compost metagenome]
MVVAAYQQVITIGPLTGNVGAHHGLATDQVVLALAHMLQRYAPAASGRCVYRMAQLQVVDLLFRFAAHTHQAYKGWLQVQGRIAQQQDVFHAAAELDPSLFGRAPAVGHAHGALGAGVVHRRLEQVLAAQTHVELVDIGKQVDALGRLHASPHRDCPRAHVAIATAHGRRIVDLEVKRELAGIG